MARFRFTVRRMMVAVAIAGAVLGVIIGRQDRFRKIAAHHRAEFNNVSRMPMIMFAGSSDDPVMLRLEWHELMRLKYERAARQPWLPVAPDPPEPNHFGSGGSGATGIQG